MKMSVKNAINLIHRECETSNVFIVLVGVPGSGKSTFVKALQDHLTEEKRDLFVVASTDDLIEREAEKLNLTYSEAWNKVNFKSLQHEFLQTIEQSIKQGLDVIVDRTNMSKKSRASVLPKAKGYSLVCVCFDVPHDELRKRLDARAVATGKVIGSHVLGSMYKNYQAPTKDEGFKHIIELM